MDTSDNTIATYTLPTGEIVTVDAIDADLLSFKWSNAHGHAYRKTPSPFPKTTYMHCEILARILGRPLIKGEFCDHKDLDRLNNRRDNLRVATKRQNQQNQPRRKDNTSGFKGVFWDKQHRKWNAQISINGKHHHIGLFATPEEAHEAYCRAATEAFGEFARC